ncbi:Porphobilinogen deaminase [hydrothermal vent metagenome]|uniref:hydroxymethylbilane synthase n=1 Tax=hydrothermal vent metagenome TaxID=652676 RepID=A0A3B0SSW4_9ZZZZ
MQDTKKDDIAVRIGTRGSPLALAQAHEVRQRLTSAHDHLTADMIEITVMSTRGDRILDRPLSEIGGKGLFTEEIEAALMDGRIDMAVHSLKDMPTSLPDGLELACYLEREDVRDAFISARARRLQDLPPGAHIGTASLRRQAQTLALRPDVMVSVFRGNVQSRLRKLDEGIVDATYLAMAGLNRLGLKDSRIHPIAVTDFLPAVAQGAVCVEIAGSNDRVRALLSPLNHADTELCVRAERAMLKILDGSCRTPIAGLATIRGGMITLKGLVSLPGGGESHDFEASGEDPEALGIKVGQTIKDNAGEGFFKKMSAET